MLLTILIPVRVSLGEDIPFSHSYVACIHVSADMSILRISSGFVISMGSPPLKGHDLPAWDPRPL